MWLEIIPGFFVFCALSSAGYLINDVLDVERDRVHQVKYARPIPSGELSATHAILFASVFFSAGLTGAYFIDIDFLLLSGLYVILTISYSLLLKRIIGIDLLVISSGFVIRIAAGAASIDIEATPWAIASVFLLAFVLVLEKRRLELNQSGKDIRTDTPYPPNYTNRTTETLTVFVTSTLIVVYSISAILNGSLFMILTIPLAAIGLIRYHIKVRRQSTTSEIEVVYKDRLIMLCLTAWVALIIVTFNDL